MIRFAIGTDHHYGAYEINNLTSDQRMQLFVKTINNEHKINPLNFLITNGDNVNDDSALLSPFKSHLDNLVIPYHVVFGGHDVCEEEQWKNLFGYGRNFDFEIGEYAFISINNWDGRGTHSYWDESEADNVWLQNKVNQYSNKKGILLFAHFITESAHPNTWNIIKRTKNIKGVFYGHIHDFNRKILDNIWVHRSGHWSAPDGSAFEKSPYSYRIVELYDNGDIYTYQLTAEHTYPFGYIPRKVLNATWIVKTQQKVKPSRYV